MAIPTPEHRRLHDLFAAAWAEEMEESPESATVLGHPGYDDRWSDVSPEAVERRVDQAHALLRELATFPDEVLDDTDRVSRDLLAHSCRERLDEVRYQEHLFPVDQLQGVQQDPAMIVEAQPARTTEEQERIVERLRRLPMLIDQTIDNLRRGLDAGLTPPQVCLRDVPQQIRNQIVDDPFDSPLLVPLVDCSDERVREGAAEAYAGVAAAYDRFHAFFSETYLPGARTSIACRDLPDGEERYAHHVRHHTTTAMTPDEIHAIGLSEVTRIRALMEEVAEDAGYDGFDGYTAHLRTSPDQHHTDAAALLEGYREIGRRVDAHLPQLFGRLPKVAYEIVAVPPYAEQSQTAAYYLPPAPDGSRAGQFFANTYDLPSRYIWEMEALTLHEAVPGHHLQIALAQELTELPEFRRNAWYTAYGEGWGLYAESLGPDVGCYADPAQLFGALTGEIWRAVRLVLDTGLHHLGWSREQAITYFQQVTGRSDHDIVVEVDRYIVWPGQALGYKVGELKIKELRARASKTLGAGFDLRAFHDEVLRHGCVPLDLLERLVDEWVSARPNG
ncbi:MAG TPA: DUF885 domain-containing protein [Acidimicrobiales bacterium]|nr:DUF885 domain-containing protein [Acidimicrobiales bacterium]